MNLIVVLSRLVIVWVELLAHFSNRDVRLRYSTSKIYPFGFFFYVCIACTAPKIVFYEN